MHIQNKHPIFVPSIPRTSLIQAQFVGFFFLNWNLMKYKKTAATIDHQIQVLKDKTLLISNEERAREYIGNFLLTEYMSYLQPHKGFHRFSDGLTFDNIIGHYQFNKSYGRCPSTTWSSSSTNLSSWLVYLTNIRNICAHHSRLWNRSLSAYTCGDENYHNRFNRRLKSKETK